MTVSVGKAAHPAPIAASIIMACRNGEPHLREALEAVAAQVWDRPWELVFVDNGSTDGSLATFVDVAARHPHIPMRAVDASDRAGKSHALNRGIAEARSDILIQCDADDVPAEGWLAAMAEGLMRHDFVSARHEIKRLNRGPAAQYRGVSKNGIYRLNFAPYCPWTMGSTMGFTRRLFDAIGGFDPDIHPEDDEFCIRAFIGGFELHPVPEAVMHYRFRQDIEGIFRQFFTYSRIEIKIAKKYAHLGPRQVGAWAKLFKNTRRWSRRYLAWRLRRGPRDLAEGALIHRRLGSSLGQIAGVLKYRGAPTCGSPPASVAEASPRSTAQANAA